MNSSEFIEKYKSNLISQYANCRFTGALLDAVLSETYEAHKANEQIKSLSDLRNNKGKNLDLTGELVAQERPLVANRLANDEEYKTLIQAKAGENNSKAMIADIEDAFSTLMNVDSCKANPYKNGFTLEYTGPAIPDYLKPIIIKSLTRICRAGVKVIDIISISESSFKFGGAFSGTFATSQIKGKE